MHIFLVRKSSLNILKVAKHNPELIKFVKKLNISVTQSRISDKSKRKSNTTTKLETILVLGKIHFRYVQDLCFSQTRQNIAFSSGVVWFY